VQEIVHIVHKVVHLAQKIVHLVQKIVHLVQEIIHLVQKILRLVQEIVPLVEEIVHGIVRKIAPVDDPFDNSNSCSFKVLDGTTFTWHLGPPLPSPVWGHCLVTTVTGELVTTGGWTSPSKYELEGLSRTHRLEGKREEGRTWKEMPDMKQGRAAHGCTADTYKVIGQEKLVSCSSDYSTRWLAIK
jgi:hypothetical protein